MKYRFEAYDVEQILNGYLSCNDNLVTQSFVQESKERHDQLNFENQHHPEVYDTKKTEQLCILRSNIHYYKEQLWTTNNQKDLCEVFDVSSRSKSCEIKKKRFRRKKEQYQTENFNFCNYKNCKRSYTTIKALNLHIKRKHKDTESLKDKEELQKLQRSYLKKSYSTRRIKVDRIFSQENLKKRIKSIDTMTFNKEKIALKKKKRCRKVSQNATMNLTNSQNATMNLTSSQNATKNTVSEITNEIYESKPEISQKISEKISEKTSFEKPKTQISDISKEFRFTKCRELSQLTKSRELSQLTTLSSKMSNDSLTYQYLNKDIFPQLKKKDIFGTGLLNLTKKHFSSKFQKRKIGSVRYDFDINYGEMDKSNSGDNLTINDYGIRCSDSELSKQ